MIEKMNLHYSFTNPASIHDEEALTALELAGRQGAKINELVEAQNNLDKTTVNRLNQQDSTIDKRMDAQDAAIETIRKTTVPADVKKECTRLIESGEFDAAINLYLGSLENRVDNLVGNTSEGNTDGNTELIDARTRANGVTYPNAGGAIRAVDKDLQEEKKNTHGTIVHHEFMNDFTNWGTGEWSGLETYDISIDNKLVYTIPANRATGNPGFSTKQFNPTDGKIYLEIDFTCNRAASVTLYVANSRGYADGNQTVISNNLTAGKHLFVLNPAEYNHEIHCFWFVHNNGSATENTYIYTFNKFKVYQSPLIDLGFPGTKASEFFSYLYNRDEGIESQFNKQMGLHTLLDSSNLYTMRGLWGDYKIENVPTVELTENSIAWTNPGDTGILTPSLALDADKLLRIDFDLTLETNDPDFFVEVFAAEGISTAHGKSVAIGSYNINTKCALIVDPAYYSVYHGFDVTRIWFVSHCHNSYVHKTKIANLKIHQNYLLDSGYSGNVARDIVTAGNKGMVETNADSFLVAPNGSKYIVQMSNSGLTAVPVVPNRALFIGNSLLNGFGFGMAASDVNHDYYALVNSAIKTVNSAYLPAKMSGSEWETFESIYAQNNWCESVLAPKLTSNLNLVVVQLGDNVNTPERSNVFAEGAKNLLKFIRTRCPNARVVWMGAWYQSQTRMNAMIDACEATGCQFIDIWDLHTEANESMVGNHYTKEDGTVVEITSEGIASHPGDAGMRAIANRFLYQLSIVESENFYK